MLPSEVGCPVCGGYAVNVSKDYQPPGFEELGPDLRPATVTISLACELDHMWFAEYRGKALVRKGRIIRGEAVSEPTLGAGAGVILGFRMGGIQAIITNGQGHGGLLRCFDGQDPDAINAAIRWCDDNGYVVNNREAMMEVSAPRLPK